MKRFKSLYLAIFAFATTLTLTNCLHITEEVTLKNNGSGTYKMSLDMSEMKNMIEMMKGMAPADSTGAEAADGLGQGNEMAQMGSQLTEVTSSLKSVQGITNIIEINDTTNFQYGYTFDFVDIAALNKAIKIINKEKYDSKAEEVYKMDGKKFERLGTADMGAELKKQMDAGGEETEDAGSQMEMVKMFFADMTYKQVYHFEKSVKKSSNELSELSDDGKTVTITLKPFNEEQAKKALTVATEIKLK